MASSDDLHRTMKLELEQGRADTLADADTLTRTYRLGVAVGPDVATSETLQAALLTVVNAATRAFRGGVAVTGDLDWPVAVRWGQGRPAREVVASLGALEGDSHDCRPFVVVGEAAVETDVAVRVTFDGWAGGVVPMGDSGLSQDAENPIAGVLAGGLAVSETFASIRGDVAAGRRSVGLSLWDPTVDWRSPAAVGPVLRYLPESLWLPGLGDC